MSFSEFKVPRRPAWDAKMSAEELNLHEREAFLDWRREIARLVSLIPQLTHLYINRDYILEWNLLRDRK